MIQEHGDRRSKVTVISNRTRLTNATPKCKHGRVQDDVNQGCGSTAPLASLVTKLQDKTIDPDSRLRVAPPCPVVSADVIGVVVPYRLTLVHSKLPR